MSDDIYKKLAKHLDELPAGFRSTKSGVELHILQRLFTPEQAALALHLTLIAEEAPVIARRAGLPLEQASQMLAEMAEAGLLYDVKPKNGAARYMATQFVVGIWEYQVKRLYPELIEDVDAYFKEAFDVETWKSNPQLRTIPVGASLPAQAEVMAYEQAEELLRSHKRFSVAECICRKERHIAGEGCDKPLETCLSMGTAADYYLRHGMGRSITLEEALHVLEAADQAGLVLQPSNSQKAAFICACCGDCCGVLRNIKRHPNPGEYVSSAYYVESDQELCAACGDCLERCQMEAISLDDGYAVIDRRRCIGCGLCVTTCPTEAMHLVRKEKDELPYVPRDLTESYLRLARQRGVLGVGDLVTMGIKSGVDRLLSSH